MSWCCKWMLLCQDAIFMFWNLLWSKNNNKLTTYCSCLCFFPYSTLATVWKLKHTLSTWSTHANYNIYIITKLQIIYVSLRLNLRLIKSMMSIKLLATNNIPMQFMSLKFHAQNWKGFEVWLFLFFCVKFAVKSKLIL